MAYEQGIWYLLSQISQLLTPITILIHVSHLLCIHSILLCLNRAIVEVFSEIRCRLKKKKPSYKLSVQYKISQNEYKKNFNIKIRCQSLILIPLPKKTVLGMKVAHSSRYTWILSKRSNEDGNVVLIVCNSPVARFRSHPPTFSLARRYKVDILRERRVLVL